MKFLITLLASITYMSFCSSGFAAEVAAVAIEDELRLNICNSIFSGYFDYDEPFSKEECLNAEFGSEKATDSIVLGSYFGKFNSEFTGDDVFGCDFSITNLKSVDNINCIRIYPAHK